ncbi:MAG: DNA methyltransferase [Polyangiales bacterium]
MTQSPPMRRPLAHLGGPLEIRGDRKLGELLAEAHRAAASEDRDTLTHGFHAYPARMHPAIPYVLVKELTGDRGTVLDPFSGSGTVAIEAMVAGREAHGVDLNPLAVRLARVKCQLRDTDSLYGFLRTLRELGDRSEERVRARVASRAPIPPEEVRHYEGHTLKELAGLREEILTVEDPRDREAFLLLLSAIVVKFSKQKADTSEGHVPKRIRKGLPTEFFVRKGEELAERWHQLRAAVPPHVREARIVEGDVRNLRHALPRGFHADLVLTSPPYGGTYDYVQHHARRYPWLGIDAADFDRGEIGARRRSQGPGAVERWDRETRGTLQSIADVLSRNGMAILLVGDGDVAGQRIDAADHLAELAPSAGLRAIAAASEERPDFTGKADRREHLVALAKA